MDEKDDLRNADDVADDGPIEAYANNVNFYASTWDLTMIFGDYGIRNYGSQDQRTSIDWHTAIKIPWTQAKLTCYFLHINLLVEEASGKISMPPHAIPSLPKETDQSDIAQSIRKLHAEFFGKIAEPKD